MSDNNVTANIHVTVETTFHGGSSGTVPLHEVPLLARKVRLMAGEMHIRDAWHPNIRRVVPLTRGQIDAEVERLRHKYTFVVGETQQYDLLTEMLPQPYAVNLVKGMNRALAAYKKLKDDPTIADLQRLADMVYQDELETIDIEDLNIDLSSGEEETVANLDGAFVDALKAEGISPRVAVEVAKLDAQDKPLNKNTLSKITKVGAATVDKILAALEQIATTIPEDAPEDDVLTSVD